MFWPAGAAPSTLLCCSGVVSQAHHPALLLTIAILVLCLMGCGPFTFLTTVLARWAAGSHHGAPTAGRPLARACSPSRVPRWPPGSGTATRNTQSPLVTACNSRAPLVAQTRTKDFLDAFDAIQAQRVRTALTGPVNLQGNSSSP